MDKKNRAAAAAVICVFLCSTLFFVRVNTTFALASVLITEKELGELCISQIVPAAQDKTAGISPDGIVDETENTAQKIEELLTKEEKKKEKNQIDVTDDPLVIIYHTHSSESYMPYKESNYHREEEEGTVRDVGAVMTEKLEERGITVIHDKTVHDRPSYNESYTRSLETIQKLAKKYPSAVYIIDLHRDAAASSATEGKYLEIDGERVAKFSLVVGQANENYPDLYACAKKVSQKADDMYDGYGGAIIEKNYNYNEFISDRAILLEVGNNKNTIEEARLCGEYFADVLASVIDEEQ